MATKTREKKATTANSTIRTILDVPGSIFDANVVRAAAIRQLQEMEDRHNHNRRQHFLRAVSNWERNFFEKGKRFPIPQPPQMLHYLYIEDAGEGEPRVIEGPELVAEPYSPPVKPTLPDGIVAFGFAVDDGTGSYYTGPTNTVHPGTHAMKDGKEYVFIIIGRLGTLVYRKMWVPIGG